MRHLMGFTLIEITIALLILAVGLVGVLALFPVGLDAVARTIKVTTATFLAQELLEGAKVAGYGGVEGSDRKDFDAPYSDFEYTIAVTSNVDGLDLKQVDVGVYWSTASGRHGSVSLTTYIAKYEP